MIKLVQGVINFHENVLPGLREQFAQLASGQPTDALMIACADGRVVPNLFASTNPGDLAVVRNVGNLVPPAYHSDGGSEVAAIEFALNTMKVKDIIVCGHSDCRGMAALLDDKRITPNLQQWIHHGQEAKQQLNGGKTFDSSLIPRDQLSQLNVMCQLDNLRTYPQVKEHMTAGALRLHGWWFDIRSGNVYAFEPDEGKFIVIDKNEGDRILARIKI